LRTVQRSMAGTGDRAKILTIHLAANRELDAEAWIRSIGLIPCATAPTTRDDLAAVSQALRRRREGGRSGALRGVAVRRGVGWRSLGVNPCYLVPPGTKRRLARPRNLFNENIPENGAGSGKYGCAFGRALIKSSKAPKSLGEGTQPLPESRGQIPCSPRVLAERAWFGSLGRCRPWPHVTALRVLRHLKGSIQNPGYSSSSLLRQRNSAEHHPPRPTTRARWRAQADQVHPW
jgi:hypothetical protein